MIRNSFRFTKSASTSGIYGIFQAEPLDDHHVTDHPRPIHVNY